MISKLFWILIYAISDFMKTTPMNNNRPNIEEYFQQNDEIIRFSNTEIELLGTLVLIETKTTELILSYQLPYEDDKVNDLCTYSILDKYNGKSISDVPILCDNFKISNLVSGTLYMVSLKNKFSSRPQNYSLVTKIEEQIKDLKLLLNGSTMHVSWKNNNKASVLIIYNIILYKVNKNLQIQDSERVVSNILLNTTQTSLNFTDLEQNMTYRIEHCSKPVISCTSTLKGSKDCFSCVIKSFYIPIPIEYSSNDIKFNNKMQFINVTYIPPTEVKFEKITHCFLSLAEITQRITSNNDFQNVYNEETVDDKQWYIIKYMNPSECTAKNFTLIPTNKKGVNTNDGYKTGYLQFSVTYCSNITCWTTNTDEPIYRDVRITATQKSLTAIAFFVSLVSLLYGLLRYYDYYKTLNFLKIYYWFINKEHSDLIEKLRSLQDSSRFPDLVHKPEKLIRILRSLSNSNVKKSIDEDDGNSNIDNDAQIPGTLDAHIHMNKGSLDPKSDYRKTKSQNGVVQNNLESNTTKCQQENALKIKNKVLDKNQRLLELRHIDMINPDFSKFVSSLEKVGCLLIFNKRIETVQHFNGSEIDLINVLDMHSFFADMLKEEENQYHRLKYIEPESTKITNTDINRPYLNRCEDVSLVGDYLNKFGGKYSDHTCFDVSRITGFHSKIEHIFPQIPTHSTRKSSLAMIFEYNIKAVENFMIHDATDSRNYSLHLPEPGNSYDIGIFNVTPKNQIFQVIYTERQSYLKFASYDSVQSGIVIYDVEVKSDNKKHFFRHFNYRLASNAPIRDEINVFMMKMVNREWKDSSNDLLVEQELNRNERESAFMVPNFKLCRFENLKETFSVFEFVSEIKKSRSGMVPNYELYKHIYRTFSRGFKNMTYL